MVEPERETPGIRANAWAVPMTSESTKRDASQGFSQVADFFSQPHQQSHYDQGACDQENMFAEIVFGGMLQQFAGNGSGDGRDRQKPEKHALVFLLFLCQIGGEVGTGRAGLGEADNFSAKRRTDNLKPGTPKIEEDGEQRSEVQRNVKAQLVRGGKFVPAEQSAHNDEMSGAGDGDEFPESLNDRKNNCLINWQGLVRRAAVGWHALTNVKHELLIAQWASDFR